MEHGTGRLSPSPFKEGGNGERQRNLSEILASLPRRQQRQARAYRPPRPIVRRPLNKFACFRCQTKKTKCDGTRPLCSACIKRADTACEYPVREGAISRYADLKVTSEQLERGNKGLRELLIRLSSRPESEALALYRQLRNTEDPLDALKFIRDADTPFTFPPANSSEPFHEIPITKADAEALTESIIRVPARPWTSVAGDGLVSHLVSDFFCWDDPLVYSFLDREPLVRDMRCARQSPSWFCSPFLANALCALRSMLSDTVRRIKETTTVDLSELFMAEAKQHLEVEAGELSITTVQGLYLLFLVTFHHGTNRAGVMYRLAALEVLARLSPSKPSAWTQRQGPGETDQRRAYLKACWGIFNSECLLSQAYLKPPPILPPSLPCLDDESGNVGLRTDVFGLPFGPLSPQPAIVPEAHMAMNNVSVLQYRVMIYNASPRGPLGDVTDMRVRSDLLLQLAALESSFPNRLRYTENPTLQTIYLKLYLNLIATNMLRPLPSNTPVQNPSSSTAKSHLLTLSTSSISLLQSYLSNRPPDKTPYPSVFLVPLATAIFTLFPYLPATDQPAPNIIPSSSTLASAPDNSCAASPTRPGVDDIGEVFSHACGILKLFERNIPLAQTLMRGVLAMAWKLAAEIPPEAAEHFHGLEQRYEKEGGIAREVTVPPVDYVIGLPWEMRERVLGETYCCGFGEDSMGGVGVDLAGLVDDWMAHREGERRTGSLDA